MRRFADPRSFACPEPFRSPLLPNPASGLTTQIDCWTARPIDGGKTFEVTRFHNWIRPETGRPNTYPYEPELLSLPDVAARFKELEQAAGLSPTAQVDQSFDAAWRDSVKTSTNPQQIVAPTFAPLAELPLMSDALASYGLMVSEVGNLSLLGEDGMPTTQENIDDGILLRAQNKWRQRKLPATASSATFTRREGLLTRLRGWLDKLPEPPSLYPAPKAQELLRLDQPYADAEALLKLIGDKPELIKAVLSDAAQKIPQTGDKRDVWDLMGIEQSPSVYSIRAAYSLLNYGKELELFAIYSHTLLVRAQEAIRIGDFAAQNRLLDAPKQGAYYAIAHLVNCERQALGAANHKSKSSWIEPFTASEDTQPPPKDALVAFLRDTVLPFYCRELADHQKTEEWFKAFKNSIPELAKKLGQEKRKIVLSGGHIENYGFDETWDGNSRYNIWALQIPRGIYRSPAELQEFSNTSKIPTAAHYLKYSQSWWRPELVVANLRPDLIRPEDRAAPARPLVRIPGVDGVPRLAPGGLVEPSRPISNGQFVKLPGGKIGELEL